MIEELTPEDEARIARIEAETAVEAERGKEARGVALAYMGLLCALLFFPFLVLPLLRIWFGAFPGQGVQSLMLWLLFEFPLVAWAAIVWRRGRISMPNGRVHTGRVVRAAAVLAVLGPLLLGIVWHFAWAALAQVPRGTSFPSQLLAIYF